MISFIIMKIKNFKSILPVMLIMTCMTLVFVYVFGIGFSKGYVPKVGIVDEDQSQTSKMIVNSLQKNKKYDFFNSTFDEAKMTVEKDDAIGFIYLEDGLEKGLEQNKVNVIFYRGGSSVEIITLESTLNALISEVLGDKGFTKGLTTLLVEKGSNITSEEVYSDLIANKSNYSTYESNSLFFNKDDGVQYDALKSAFTGFLLFFSMFTIMFGIGTIVDEKELKVWHRQLVSPLTKRTILTGNLVSNFVLGMLQLLLIVLASKFLFDMDWGGSTIALLSVLGAYVIAGTAMGLFIAGFVKTQQQLAAALPTIIVATSMIGGCMWPVELMQSKFLRSIAEVLPQRWGMEGLSQVIMYNGGMEDVIKPVIILLIMGAVFLIASIIPFKKSLI